MRVLVTGAAGFIGSYLCERLIEDGHQVVGVDNLFRGVKDHLASIIQHPMFRFVEGDVSQDHVLDACEEAFGGFELIHHLAAINGTRWFHEAARTVIDVNVNTTLKTLAAAERWGSRYVFASSPEAFGDAANMPLMERSSSVFPSSHDHQRHSYGGSKYLGELAVQHALATGLDARIVRPFNAYGSRLLGDAYGQVIGMMFHAVRSQEAINVHGNGSQTRSFTHINDVIEGFVLAGERSHSVDGQRLLSGCSFNIGSSEEVSILELSKRIVKVTGTQIAPVVGVEGYFGDSKRRVPDCSSAERLLGWRCSTSLDTGLAEVWQELTSHP
ncbi:MAG: hypothetical protein CMA65_05625 [Euryarchaeota archaeon]|nr:hypothetical protein [Euryarchaeota archaeon]